MAGHRADMMKLLKKAEKQGCSVERLRNGHWKVTAPNGDSFHAPFSPRTPGGVTFIATQLKRAGVKL